MTVEPSRTQVRAVAAELRELMLVMQARRARIADELHIGLSEVSALDHLHSATSLTPSELGRLVGLTSGSVTALLDRLERDGLIVREANPEDKRSSLVRATPAGRSATNWMVEGFDVAVREGLRGSDLDTDQLSAFVRALTDALQTGED